MKLTTSLCLMLAVASRAAAQPSDPAAPGPVAPAVIDAAKSVNVARAVADVRAGVRVLIRLDPQDSNGNRVAVGAQEIWGYVNGPPGRALMDVEAIGNGAYWVSWKPEKAGAYELAMYAQGVALTPTPERFSVSPGAPSLARSTLDAADTLVENTKRSIYVHLFDDYGNVVTADGQVMWAHFANGEPLEPVSVGGGAYRIELPGQHRGTAKLEVFLNGEVLDGGDLQVVVRPKLCHEIGIQLCSYLQLATINSVAGNIEPERELFALSAVFNLWGKHGEVFTTASIDLPFGPANEPDSADADTEDEEKGFLGAGALSDGALTVNGVAFGSADGGRILSFGAGARVFGGEFYYGLHALGVERNDSFVHGSSFMLGYARKRSTAANADTTKLVGARHNVIGDFYFRLPESRLPSIVENISFRGTVLIPVKNAKVPVQSRISIIVPLGSVVPF